MRALRARVVTEQPFPPRHVPLLRVVGTLRDPLWVFLAFVGFGWLALLAYVVAVGEWTVAAFSLAALSLVGGTAFLGSLAFMVVTFARSLRGGRAAHAIVVSVDTSPSPGETPTLDGLEHGMTRGTRRVVDGARTFEEAFLTDAPWSRTVRPGTRMRVLVHPTKEGSFFDSAVETEDAPPVAPAGRNVQTQG